MVNQERDVDLLLVDSGDLHDGVYMPNFCKKAISLTYEQEPVFPTDFLPVGWMLTMYVQNFKSMDYLKYMLFQANQFIKRLPYDIMAIGKSVVIITHDIIPFLQL